MPPLPSFIIPIPPLPSIQNAIIHKSKIENEWSNVEQAYFSKLLMDEGGWGGVNDVIPKQAVVTVQTEK